MYLTEIDTPFCDLLYCVYYALSIVMFYCDVSIPIVVIYIIYNAI